MKLYGITKKNQMLYHIICDLIPFNVIVWYNSYFHMLYHIIHNVIPLFLTVYILYNTMYIERMILYKILSIKDCRIYISSINM